MKTTRNFLKKTSSKNFNKLTTKIQKEKKRKGISKSMIFRKNCKNHKIVSKPSLLKQTRYFLSTLEDRKILKVGFKISKRQPNNMKLRSIVLFQKK